MFRSFKGAAAFYLIACVVCAVTFFGSHRWGYLVAAVVWALLAVYCIVRERDDSDLRK